MVMFLVIPDFGQTVLWLTGSCNYLWTTTTMILFILPYVCYIYEKKEFSKYLYGPFIGLAFLSGGSNENTSGAIILCAIIMMVYMYWYKIKIKSWMVMGVIFAIGSFCIMIVSPGYQVRSEQISQSNSMLVEYVDRFMKATQVLYNEMGIFIFLLVCMLVLGIYYKLEKNILVQASIFLITGLASNYAMIFTPYYPERAFMGTAIFMLIGGMILFYHLVESWIQVAKKILVTCMIVKFIFVFLFAFEHIFGTYYFYIVREDMIETQVNVGVMDIEIFKITSDNPYSVFYFGDLANNSNVWPNPEIAKYYGINSITEIGAWGK